MKKCPKCKAELQEEARFCLYCMTSFEEKQTIETPKENNKRWLYIIATVLVLVILISCFFIFKPKDKESAAKNSTVLSSSINSILTSSNNGGTASSQPQSDVSDNDKASVPANSSQSQPSSTDTNSTSNDSSSNTTTSTAITGSTASTSSDQTVSSNSQSSTVSSSTVSSSTSTVSSESTSSSVSSNSTVSHVTSSVPDTEPKYTYIEATFENTYPDTSVAMYAPENAIVITKVNYKEESGVYVIPDTVDGKKVVAIMPSAFSDPSISSSVKSVTLPSKVRTIWNDAFEGCFNLTDLYLKTTVVEIFEDSFPETSQRNGRLTIHCKKDCRNFYFYYYRNIASRYDADYEEWNG